jgi:hypothetical protein
MQKTVFFIKNVVRLCLKTEKTVILAAEKRGAWLLVAAMCSQYASSSTIIAYIYGVSIYSTCASFC